MSLWNIIGGIAGVSEMICDNYTYKKPEWMEHFEFYEERICKNTGLRKDKLREVVKEFMEYKILEEGYL